MFEKAANCQICLNTVNDWAIDWLTDQLIDWMTDWLTDWLTDWMTSTDRAQEVHLHFHHENLKKLFY